MKVIYGHGALAPRTVPVQEGLRLGRPAFYGDPVGRPFDGKGCRPAGADGFTGSAGEIPDYYTYPLGAGVSRVDAGEMPCVRLVCRTDAGSYAKPGMVNGLGFLGHLRVQVGSAGNAAYLDTFDSIRFTFRPGSAQWDCTDRAYGHMRGPSRSSYGPSSGRSVSSRPWSAETTRNDP